MSLSPLVSFKSRFVTYLLNFPRKLNLKFWKKCSIVVVTDYSRVCVRDTFRSWRVGLG